jgi:hypothetical protein
MSDSSSEEKINDLVAKYAPSLSRSMLLQAAAQALGNAAHNATFAQQQTNMIINTNTALSAAMLHSVGATYAKK